MASRAACTRRQALRSAGAFAALLAGAARAGAAFDHSAAADPAVAFVRQLPGYQPAEQVRGSVELWGHGSFKHDFMGPLVQQWMAGLRRHQPGLQLEYRMYGTASAISALYTGAANVALLGEEISPASARAFRRARGYAPTRVDVATGSLDVNYFDYAHMVFVHRDNPVRGLTLAQLDAVFGAEHRRGPANIRRWGQLGLGGDWRAAPIQPYAWQVDEDFALFFRAAVLAGSHRWNEATREYLHAQRPDGTQYDHGARILDALAADRFGIALSNVRYANAQVRAVPLARQAGGPFVTASTATLVSQDYPLVRIIPAYVDRPPGGRIAAPAREFLRYLLSREGQAALLTHSGYLPLGERHIAMQKAILS